MLLGSPPDMIRGHPLRKTGSAASHGGLSTELFYYKSGRLATGKKQMWRVSQKIHRGSLAFFGKWDKINRIRGMLRPKKCAAQRNPPVTASPCQPPLGKGAVGTGVRMSLLRCPKFLRCLTADAGNFDRGHSLTSLLLPLAALGSLPTTSLRTGLAMTHYKECGKRDDVSIVPYAPFTDRTL